MDVQRELKLTNIQELSALPEQVTMSPHSRERERERGESMTKTDASQKEPHTCVEKGLVVHQYSYN